MEIVDKDEIYMKINELIGADRSQLNKENSAELVLKLKSKINSLKDNFVVNLPPKYNDENEFANLCSKISALKSRLYASKAENQELQDLLYKYKSNDNKPTSEHEAEIKSMIFKSICIKRQICYIQCIKQLVQFK